MQGFGSVLQIYYYQHMGRVMIIKFFNHSFHARKWALEVNTGLVVTTNNGNRNDSPKKKKNLDVPKR